MKTSPKRKLSLCFFGHLRTYEQTHEAFFQNLIKANEKEWDIDIFIHTWDEFEKSGFAWHNHLKKLSGKKLEPKDIEKVKQIYRPKQICIESLTQERGSELSLLKCQELARIYAKEQNLHYDYTLVTRPDLYFQTPLHLNTYIDFYTQNEDMKWLGLAQKHIFSASNFFARMPIADPRYFCEGDLLFFGNFNPLPFCAAQNDKEALVIGIDYRLHIDFFLQRVDFKVGFDENDEPLDAINLVKNHLAYKFGVCLEKCESFYDYVRILWVLSYVYELHKKGKDQRPKYSLTNCKNHLKARKIKASSAYLLGQACIEAFLNKGILGLCKFVYFDLAKLKKKYQQKEI